MIRFDSPNSNGTMVWRPHTASTSGSTPDPRLPLWTRSRKALLPPLAVRRDHPCRERSENDVATVVVTVRMRRGLTGGSRSCGDECRLFVVPRTRGGWRFRHIDLATGALRISPPPTPLPSVFKLYLTSSDLSICSRTTNSVIPGWAFEHAGENDTG